MLDAIIAWAPDLIRPKECLIQIPRHIKEHLNGKFMLFFKDAIDALHGTHINCLVEKKSHLAFRCRRDPRHTTQNVLRVYDFSMRVCDFSMRFTFVSAG